MCRCGASQWIAAVCRSSSDGAVDRRRKGGGGFGVLSRCFLLAIADRVKTGRWCVVCGGGVARRKSETPSWTTDTRSGGSREDWRSRNGETTVGVEKKREKKERRRRGKRPKGQQEELGSSMGSSMAGKVWRLKCSAGGEPGRGRARGRLAGRLAGNRRRAVVPGIGRYLVVL